MKFRLICIPDASDFCWILFVYNSKEFVDEEPTKGWDYLQDDHTLFHVFQTVLILYHYTGHFLIVPLVKNNVMCAENGSKILKGLMNAINKLFYERCGVATVDMSFPSNELMFGGFLDEIDDYPVIIFKEPYLG